MAPGASSLAVPLGLLAAASSVLAAPPNQVIDARHPMITHAPSLKQRELAERAFDPASYINSVVSGLGSDVSSFVASGVPQYFQNLPTGSQVQSSLGISDSDLAAKPTQVLNVP